MFHSRPTRRATSGALLAAVLMSLVAVVAFFALAARPSAAAQSPLKITAVIAQASDPYFNSMKCGAQAAAKKFGGVQLSWQGPTAPSVAQEVTAFGSVVVTKPDGVILSPFSPTAFIQPVSKLMREGVPVYLVDAFLGKRVAFHATFTDVTRSAPQLAAKIAALMGGKGELGIVAFQAGDPYEGMRYMHMVKVLKAEYPKIKVLPVQYAEADTNKAAQVTSGLIAAHPGLSAIYATDGPEGQGAVAALRTAHLTGKVKVIAFDAEPLEVRGLQDGSIQALYAQAPYLEGYNAMTGLVRYLRGAGVSKHPVTPGKPYYIPTPLKFITKADLSKAATKKFLYRTSC